MRFSVVTAVVLVSTIGTAFADEAVKLIPPATSTKETRSQNMFECLSISQEISKVAPEVSPFERTPLKGQETGRFLFGDRPSSEDEGIPTRYSSALGVNWAQSANTDRYVLCLLAIGYQWPPSISSSSAAANPAGEISSKRESTLLYNAGRIYRKRGVLAEAERLLRRSLEIEESLSGGGDPKTLRRAAELSAAYFQLERYDEGLPLAKRLLPAATSFSGGQKEFVLLLLESYAKELRKRNQDADASIFEAKVKELR
jgi:tetratricopeptide (TPR) repeat protein